MVLPSHVIRADEKQFERRYGLRDKEPLLIVRCLDQLIQQELNLPFSELALPLPTLAELAVRDCRIFILENRATLRTFPSHPRGIALEGRGRAVTDLRDVEWLAKNELFYWGDLDVEGFEILSSLRGIFPDVRSFLMDAKTLERHGELAVSGRGSQPNPPAHLTAFEVDAFARCRDDNLRLEQERIPQSSVLAELTELH